MSIQVMKSNLDKGKLSTQFKDRVEKFEQFFNDPEQFNKIFTELGFIIFKVSNL